MKNLAFACLPGIAHAERGWPRRSTTRYTGMTPSFSVKGGFMYLVRSVVLMLMALVSCTAIAADVPEFDGAYIKTNSGSFIEIKTKQAYTTQIIRGGMTTDQLLYGSGRQVYYYVANKDGIQSIERARFKGIAIRGRENFNNFSLHPLDTMKLSHGENLYENHGPGGNTLYVPGKQIDVRKKSTGSDSYYFEPAASLEKGEYIVWIDKKFWLIEIK